MSGNKKKKLSIKTFKKAMLFASAFLPVIILISFLAVNSFAAEYAYTDIASLQTALGTAGASTTASGVELTELQFSSEEIAHNSMIVLSNAHPSLYPNCVIKSNPSYIDLTGSYSGMVYCGLGGDSVPFAGALQLSMIGEEAMLIRLNGSLFNNIDTAASLPANLQLELNSGSVIEAPVLASKVSASGEASKTLNISLIGSQTNSTVTTGGFIGTVCDGINLTLGLSFSNISSYTVSTNGNAGAICNSIGNGSSLTVSTFSPSITVNVSGAASGAVVGSVGNTSALTVNTFAPSGAVTITSASGKAGGVVGEVGSNSQVTVGAFTSSGTVTVSGNEYAGGVVGHSGEDSRITATAFSPDTVNVSSALDAGGAVGGLDGSAYITITTYSPDTLTVRSTGSNAGAVVGAVDANADLTIGSFAPSGNITVSGNIGAGSVAGTAASGLKLALTNGWSVPSGAELEITGNQFAGALFGQIIEPNINMPAELIRLDGKTTVIGKNVGGVFGKLIVASSSATAPALEYDTNSRIILQNAAAGETLGGIVGLLELANENAVYTVGGTAPATKLNIYTSINISGNLNNSVGGVIGYAYADASEAKNAKVIVQNVKADMSLTGSNPRNNGGIIGKLGITVKDAENKDIKQGIYARISGCVVETNNPVGSSYGFGGAVAYLNGNTVLLVDNFTLNTSDREINGAGVVSQANEKDVVCFSGTLDLSNAKFGDNSLGQVIGSQKSSLIYAMSGLVFNRGQGNGYANDIGNYGGIIRLGGNLSADLFTIDASNRVKLEENSMYDYTSSSKTVEIASADQFVVLACSIQNNFFLPSGVRYNDSLLENSDLLKASISITADINLSGTGVYSLMRDIWEKGENPFSGSLIGNKSGNAPIITIDTGAEWGNKHPNGSKLDGRIIGLNRPGETHSNLGLLRTIKGNVTISNIEINGSFKYYSNRDYSKAGVFAGYVEGSNVTFNNITLDVDTEFNHVSGSENDYGYLMGCGTGGGGTLSITNCTFKNKVVINKGNNNSCRFGCLAGCIQSGGFGYVSINDDALLCDVTMTGDGMFGGMAIGYIYKNVGSYKKVTIDNLSYGNNAKRITLQTKSGGLLGHTWYSDVEFVNGTEESHAMLADNVKIQVSAAQFGGLCYMTNGFWSIPEYGIRFNDLDIEKPYKGSTGLLIYDGKSNSINGDSSLYLELSHQNSIDIITNSGKTSITAPAEEAFDELVYLLFQSGDSLVNGNSIISVATTDGEALIDQGANPNTYTNKTTNLGATWPENNNTSRYYYNLHLYRTKESAALTSAQKLLIWSVQQYVNTFIKNKCFNKNLDNPLDCGSLTTFDLSGYSYYPIDVSGVTVRNAIVIFNNAQLQNAESSKASPATRMLTNQKSQHYMMHGGLFNDTVNLTVNNLTLRGNTVYDFNNQGVLIGGTAAGTSNSSKNNLNIENVKLDGIYLNGYTDGSAPLLINRISNYSNLNMRTVYTVNESGNKYQDTNTNDSWFAGSSLIGDVGYYENEEDAAREISLKFSDIRLDGRIAKGVKLEAYGTYRSIFSRATLLNSFKYKENCSGTYNFTMDEDWEGANHLQHVTYGKEISTSSKNPDEQLRYYDSTFFVNAASAPNEASGSDFSSAYLKYVFSTDTGAYEIDVNLTIYVFVNGCGTYGDPYVITRGGQLEGLEYLFVNGEPKNGVIVCIYSGSTESPHVSAVDSYHKFYKYDKSTEQWTECDTADGIAWTPTVTVTTAAILEHMRTAYYYIDNDISVSGLFVGIGTEIYPFSGVIVGKSATPTVTVDGYESGAVKTIKANGLINVAKGCVVKNINLYYDGTVTVTNEAAPQNYVIADYFGGVIGYVMGGDNVIDAVSVTLPTVSIAVNSNKNHLCTVGGVVGVINNGGVVFRGANTVIGLDAKFNETAYASLYVNPYIGRVLDGYAFSESETETLVNNDKQYKIPTLTDGQINVSGQVIAVTSPRDLYILSALINSGAIGSKDASKPIGYGVNAKYRGRATYDNVKPASAAAAEADYANAKKDNTGSDGSYLFSFVNGTLNGTDIYNARFSTDIDFDGTAFDGTAFRGLGGRYGIPLQKLTMSNVASRTLGLKMLSREYFDDNFISKGIGFFNQLGAFSNESINLTIVGSVNSLNYNSSGVAAAINLTPPISAGDAGTEAGVGAFAGYILNNSSATINGVTLGDGTDRLTVNGSYCVGGLFGMKEGTGTLNIQDCLINGETVRSNMYAGGLFGLSVASVNVTITHAAAYSDITIEPNATALLRNYTSFGGFAGFAKTLNIGSAANAISINGLNIENPANQANVCIGGLIGNSDYAATIRNIDISDIQINGREDKAQSGGVIGKISNLTVSVTIDDVNVNIGNSGYIYGKYAGGYIGSFSNAGKGDVIVENSRISGSLIRGEAAVGGVVGYIDQDSKSFTASNLSINVSNIRLPDGKTSGHVGGVVGQMERVGLPLIENIRIAETNAVNILGRATVGKDQDNSVGGIVGRAAPYRETMIIRNAEIGYAYPVLIASGEDAGAIIGYVSSFGIQVIDSGIAKGGSVTVEAFGTGAISANAGGIIGQSDNNVSVSGSIIGAAQAVIINGDNAGGVVGRISGSSDVNVTITNTQIAKTASVTVLSENGFSGGAVGIIDKGKATINGFKTGNAGNTAMHLVIGKQTAGEIDKYSGSSGGIIGIIDTGAALGTEINNAFVYNAEVFGKHVAGGAVGIAAKSFKTKNSVFDGISVNGSIVGDEWTSSSAFVGRLTTWGTTADGYNIFLKSVSVQDGLAEPQLGLWVGSTDGPDSRVKLIGVSAENAPNIDDVNGDLNVEYIIYTDFEASGDPTEVIGGAVDVANRPVSGATIGGIGNETGIFGHGVAIKVVGAEKIPYPAYILSQAERRGYITELTGDNMTTYNSQHIGSTAEDFSTFLITDTESNALTEAILKYASFITSGGSDGYFASTKNCISVDTYEYTSGRFVKKATATLSYNSATGKFSLNGVGNRDSDKAQFTLITFSFTNDSISDYKLYIPIIVARQVEVTIDVGVAQGSVFRESLVNETMALTEYGKKATVRIEYKYYYDNWNESLLNWSYSKNIRFTRFIDSIPESAKLPNGAYITLIDMQSGDLAYTYVVSGGSISSLNGTVFNTWTPKNMNQLLIAERADDPEHEYALWVQDNINSEITIDSVGYRKKTAEDTTDEVYILYCKESYLLVIELPYDQNVGAQYRDILFLFDDQLSGGFPNVVTAPQTARQLRIFRDTTQSFLRVDESVNGSHTGFIENKSNEVVLTLSSTLELDKDVISDTTKRYMQFSVGLKYFNSAAVGYKGAIKLTPSFVITPQGEAPINIEGSIINMNCNGQKQITVSVNDGGTVVELAQYTDRGYKTVTVDATLVFEFTPQAAQSTFPTSTLNDGTPVSYASFDPIMIISDNYSFLGGNRQRISNEVFMEKYYRASSLEELLELVADSSQLAINPGATSEPEDQSATIDATGTISITGYESEFNGYDSMAVTVKLYKKGNDGVYHQIDNSSMGRYLSSVNVAGNTVSASNDYTQAIQSGVDGSYGGLLEDNVLKIPLTLAVKRKPSLDSPEIMYSNYKVEMEIKFYTGNTESAVSRDYFIYTLAKIFEDF